MVALVAAVEGNPNQRTVTRIVVQRFAESGIPFGQPIDVARFPEQGIGPLSMFSDSENPAIAMRPDGGFIVAWTVRSVAGFNNTVLGIVSSQLYIRRYDAMGQPEGSEQLIAGRVISVLREGIQIVMNSLGDYAEVYRQIPITMCRSAIRS